MRNSKIHIVFLILLLLVFSCKSKGDSNNTNGGNALLTTPQEEKHLNDSSLKEIICLYPKWVSSWNWEETSLKADDFKPELEATKSIVWEEYNADDAYLKQYDSLLVTSNQFAIDLYSYSALIEREGKDVFVEFDVDSKVYVLNRKKEERCEVAHTGSYEVIEDAIWLNGQVVLLGYIDEATENHTPFIWIIDVEKQREVRYRYFKSFEGLRKEFFFVKYPNTKIREW